MVRVAVVAGVRTPFARAGTAFRDLPARTLGTLVVDELVRRGGIEPGGVDRVIFGQVAPDLSGPNIAREVVLDSRLPPTVDAYSVVRACATSYQAIVDAVLAIGAGDIDCAIAGGADSASHVPIPLSRPLTSALLDARRARGLGDRLLAFRGLRPRDLLPSVPELVERSTGLSMGESAEQMARANRIGRAAQDEYAHRSHTLAAAAWADGRFAEEVMEVSLPARGVSLARDNAVRPRSRLDAYARLRPVFGDGGTVTAGNSSPLTDGAAAVLLMSEARVRTLGVTPLGWVRAWAFAAIDPAEQMLLAPAWAIPRALERTGLTLSDLTLLDLHEAFAAQVLSLAQKLESPEFAERELGRRDAVGKVDWQRTNVMGGSLALGHPFAATGARQVTQVLREMNRRGGGVALCSACAAGGLGAALVLGSA